MYVQRCLLFLSSSFQLSVKNDARFVRFYSGLPHDWSRKLATLSKPIRFKTETNLDLIAAFSRPLDSLVVFGFPFFSPHDWSTEFVPLSEPIRFKIKTNLDLVAGVFPRSKQFGVYPRISFTKISWHYGFDITTSNEVQLGY